MHVRAARPDDYEAWLRFWAELGLTSTPPSHDRWLAGILPNTIFLEEAGVLAAYNLSFAFGTRGDVRQVAVAPEFRKRGVGKQLMAAVAAKLRAAGCTDWRLEVRADNAPAIALYRAVGMQPLRDLHTVRMGRDACEHFAASRSGRFAATAVIPDDDVRLEAAFDLGAGQIQRWRTFRPQSPIVRIGFAALIQIHREFSTGHGWLFPFEAPDTDTAAHLLAEALPNMPAEYELQLARPELYAALLAAGARPEEHLIEFTGQLA
jgi:ribosomal protein S18 acetylase RimI-like enzyme